MLAEVAPVLSVHLKYYWVLASPLLASGVGDGVGVGYLWTEVVSLTRPRTVTLFALIFCLGHRLSSKFTLWCQPQPWLTALAVPTKLLDSGG